jgi:tRNA 2-thiouridine synthesizing protein A
MVTSQESSLVLDTKGTLCPLPVLRTSQAIKQVRVGEVLEVLATDPGSKPDLTAWARMTGNELVDATEEPGNPKVYRFQIRRTR